MSAPLLKQLCDPRLCEPTGVCCFCHAAHVSISPLLLHSSQGLSHAGARGSSFLIEWASRLQGPQSTSSTKSESIEQPKRCCASKEQWMLVTRNQYLVMATWTTTRCAWRWAEARQQSSGISCPRRHVFPFPGAASNFAASSEYNKKRGRHRDQSSLGGTSPRTLQNKRGQHHDSHSAISPRRMAKSGGARRGLLVLVRHSSTVEQADSCVHVTPRFFSHDSFGSRSQRRRS